MTPCWSSDCVDYERRGIALGRRNGSNPRHECNARRAFRGPEALVFLHPRMPTLHDTSPRTGMTNYPRDEFDRVPEFSNRSGSHRENGWAAAASVGGARSGLRWL